METLHIRHTDRGQRQADSSPNGGRALHSAAGYYNIYIYINSDYVIVVNLFLLGANLVSLFYIHGCADMLAVIQLSLMKAHGLLIVMLFSGQ